jgi:hypothetical protein
MSPENDEGRALAGNAASKVESRGGGIDLSTVTHPPRRRTTLVDANPRDRRRILARLDELAELAQLARQRGALADAGPRKQPRGVA